MAFYGDDFTGSTDAMESLSYGGVETVLFVHAPSDELLHRYAHVRAIGIAGSSRAMSPDEMEISLPTAFQALIRHKPAVVHYKTCSTFDSSPQVGSIGRAIDIGHRVFKNRMVPLVVGAPVLQRFCVFGNLFARSGLDSAPYRLDRHPTMSRHPVTPMNESDLRVHLSHQTSRPVALIDVLRLDHEDIDWSLELDKLSGGEIVMFDTLTEDHLSTIGRVLWQAKEHESGPLFVAGSSGVEYCLTRHWRTTGHVHSDFKWTKSGGPVDQVMVVSGSCSPVTERQIAWAAERGFAEIALQTELMGKDEGREAEIRRVAGLAISELKEGRSVIVHSSRGPDDRRIAKSKPLLGDARTSSEILGKALGRIVHETLDQFSLERIAVTGGDTSGHVARSLNIDALEMLGPLAPGSPLCLARSKNRAIDGLEITFKGGQVGHNDFFKSVLLGR